MGVRLSTFDCMPIHVCQSVHDTFGMLSGFLRLPQSRYKIRVVSARAYHCLFMRNMLIRPTEDELASFGRPDFTIFNAGAFPCNRYTSFMTSSSSVNINLKVRDLQVSFSCAPLWTIWAANLSPRSHGSPIHAKLERSQLSWCIRGAMCIQL
jgi:hypothetical protein